MGTQLGASLKEHRNLFAKEYERSKFRLTCLQINPDIFSEQELRQKLYDEKYFWEDLRLRINLSPFEAGPPVPQQLEGPVPPPTPPSPPSPFEACRASKAYNDELNKELELRRDYADHLVPLSKEELIEQVKREIEETKNELKELKLLREWWNQYPADYEHWGRMPYWSVEEGIALSLGCDPKEINLDSMKSESYDGIPSKHAKRHEIAARSIAAKEINETKIQPIAFLEWLESKGYDYPGELAEAAGYHQYNAEGTSANLSVFGLQYTKEASTNEVLVKHRYWMDLWLISEKEEPGLHQRGRSARVWTKLGKPNNPTQGTIRKACSAFNKANPSYTF